MCRWIIRLVTALFHQFSDAFAHLLKLALYDFQLLCRGVEGFGAGCTVGNEMALIFLRINQGLAGRDADHNGALWHVPGHNRISTHASTRTDDNGPQYLNRKSTRLNSSH